MTSPAAAPLDPTQARRFLTLVEGMDGQIGGPVTIPGQAGLYEHWHHKPANCRHDIDPNGRVDHRCRDCDLPRAADDHAEALEARMAARRVQTRAVTRAVARTAAIAFLLLCAYVVMHLAAGVLSAVIDSFLP